MTDTLRSVRPASGKPKVSAGLGVAPLPVRMPDRIQRKKTMEAAQIELGSRSWAPGAVAGSQQITLREQCPGSLVEETGDKRR